MNYDKLSGYALLVLGIAIIIWILFSSYNIFTGKTPAPDLFKNEITIKKDNANSIPLDNLNQEDMQKYISQSVQEGINNLLPDNFINKIIDLTCWGAFAGIAIFAGGKLGSLGINLIVKSRKEENNKD